MTTASIPTFAPLAAEAPSTLGQMLPCAFVMPLGLQKISAPGSRPPSQ